MKQQTFLLVIVLLFGISLQAAREKEQFLRGNKFFQENNVEQALQEYQEISNKGPVLWYNIGVCYLSQKEYLQALVAFKKAQIYADPSLCNQIIPLLDYVNKKLSLPSESEFMIFAQRCAAYFSLFWLQLLFLIFWWTYIILSWLTVRSLRLLKTFLLLAGVTLGLLTTIVWWVRSESTGIVVKESSLFIGPNSEFHTTGSVSPGQTVSIEQTTKSWYKVKNSQNSGWVEKTAVEQIEL